MFGRGKLGCFWFREGGALAGIGEYSDGAIADGDRFCDCITFAAGFEIVVETGVGVQGWHSVPMNIVDLGASSVSLSTGYTDLMRSLVSQ